MIRFSKSNNKYGCFSNFCPCSVKYQQMDFDNSEVVYQSMKTLDMSEREKFIGLDGKEAKKLGKKSAIRPDWEAVKYPIMVDVCFAKFSQN